MLADLRLFTFAFLLLTLFSGCALMFPDGQGNRSNTAVASSTVADLLKPNESGLSYPVYTAFSEIEPFLQQNDGITYVVNFWATWCRPCIREMEYFEQLTRETDRKNLQVIMISVDKEEDVRTKMKEFVKSRPLNLPVVAFTDNFYDGWIYKVDDAWQRSSIPVTLIYRNGERHFNKGQISSYEELRGLVGRVSPIPKNG